MEHQINIGLIGYGMGGRVFHAPVIESVPGLRLFKVYETKPENIAHLTANYHDVQVVSTVEDILSDPEVELVVIATPNVYHYDLARRAMENGKHVVVEKPFTVTTEEADRLIALATVTQRLLTVHQNRRWDSDFRTVEKVVKSNLLGKIVDYEANFDRYRIGFKNNWREEPQPGSGILYDLGSHLIDQALVLFGLPREVFAMLEIEKEGGCAIDYFKVILKYPGFKATLKAGMLVREATPRFALYGTKGSFVKYGLDVQEEALKNGLLPKQVEEWGREPEELWGKINTEVDGLHLIGKVESELGDYREFYKNVYQAILGQAPLAVEASQARNTIRIIELAEASQAQKGWIPLE